MARPKYQIDYDALKACCGILCTGEECAAILGVDYDTLNNRLKEDGHGGFSDFFKRESSSGKQSLRRAQMEVALKGNPTMLIWLGKQWLNQRDKEESPEPQKAEPIEFTRASSPDRPAE